MSAWVQVRLEPGSTEVKSKMYRYIPLSWCSHLVVLPFKLMQPNRGLKGPFYKIKISTVIVIVYTGNLTKMAAV